MKIMKKSCKRTSPLDPFPHQVFNHRTKPFSTAIAKLINMSFQEGHFSSIYKTAQIIPLLKKPNLDPTVPEHFRPISNLFTISKIVERAILIQLRSHITKNHNFPNFQSAYRSNHSTETALLHVLDEVYVRCDNKKASILTSLDLSAAFDTINHRIPLERLSREFGIESLALKWLKSYLTERKQFVKLGNHSSSTVNIEHGVPQGSALGPLLFTIYISPISSIFNNFNLTHHQYADDIQILIKINPHNLSNSISTLTDCFKMVERWFLLNKLQLNTSKTEVIKIDTPQQLNKFSSLSSINFGSTSIDLIKKLKVLGITIDEKLSFDYHITTVIRSCNHHLRALSHIRQFFINDMASTLARCLVLSRLDYCNSFLYNITEHQQERLQRIMNKAAKISLNINTPHHYLHHSSKNYLSQLHWLSVYNRIIFKIALITYKTYTTSIPGYLSNFIQNRPNPRLLRSSSATLLIKNSTTNKISERSFRHASPAVWNFLPPHIRNSPSLATFKSHLKTYLFRLSFNNI